MGGITVEIRNDEVRRKEGVSARTGNGYVIREQAGFIHLPQEPYPQRCSLTLDDEAPPYQPGIYVLSDSSYYIGRFDQVMLRVRLDRDSRKPLSQPRAATA